MKRFKTGLVLSGGAARGLAHIGTIAELDRYGIKFDVVIGTSMGSIIGALYALIGKPRKIYDYVYDYLNSEEFHKSWLPIREGEDQEGLGIFHRFLGSVKKGIYYTRSLTRMSLMPLENYEELINSIVDDVLIEDLPVQYGAIAVDLDTAEEVVICSGSLRKALAASCAIPGIFPPINIAGRRLVDGGWLDNLPVFPAFEMGSNFIIASDTSWDIDSSNIEPQCAMDIVFRSNEITRIFLNRMRRSFVDVLIVPKLGNIQWPDLECMPEAVTAGREAASRELKRIRWREITYRIKTIGGILKRQSYPYRYRNTVYI